MLFKAELLADLASIHGECSWWDSVRNTLYWLDCMGGKFYSYNDLSGSINTLELPFFPMTFVPHVKGGFIFASRDSIILSDDSCSAFRTIARIRHASFDMRFNDGKCDPAGRFYVGSMGCLGQEDAGILYMLDSGGKIEPVVSGVAISNGIVWNGAKMYYTDTIFGDVYAFDYDATTGKVSNKKTIFHTSVGMPDGMCMDAAGNIWAALWGGYKAICFDPNTGKVLHEVELPVPFVSSVSFGGPELKTLFITTSRLDMPQEEIEKYPLSGGLFTVKTDIRGAEMFRCAV